MKKYLVRAPLVTGLAALLLAIPTWKKDGLKDITQPYLGEYECVEAKLNSTDYLERFSSLTLELRPNGAFVLHYREKGGKQKKVRGNYRYDAEKETLTLTAAKGAFQREFPLKQGELTVALPVRDKILLLKFSQK